jgi:hypothetical protein
VQPAPRAGGRVRAHRFWRRSLLAKGLLLFTALPEFWMPMAALPLWVALAFDRRTAFLVEVGVAFIAASLLRFDLVL